MPRLVFINTIWITLPKISIRLVTICVRPILECPSSFTFWTTSSVLFVKNNDNNWKQDSNDYNYRDYTLAHGKHYSHINNLHWCSEAHLFKALFQRTDISSIYKILKWKSKNKYEKANDARIVFVCLLFYSWFSKMNWKILWKLLLLSEDILNNTF